MCKIKTGDFSSTSQKQQFSHVTEFEHARLTWWNNLLPDYLSGMPGMLFAFLRQPFLKQLYTHPKEGHWKFQGVGGGGAGVSKVTTFIHYSSCIKGAISHLQLSINHQYKQTTNNMHPSRLYTV